MKKIETKLLELIEKEPQIVCKTIIVFEVGTDVNELKISDFNMLMSNILSVTLTGEEIIRLSKCKAVISIEPDMEMGML